MIPFAKIFEYPEGQLLVTNDRDTEKDRNVITFRTDFNGLILEQRLGFPPGESSDEVFARITAEKALPTFRRLQELGQLDITEIPEPTYSLFDLAVQVEDMRNAQKLYFREIAKARKSKLPDDFNKAKQVQAIAVAIEISVDDTIREILRPIKEMMP